MGSGAGSEGLGYSRAAAAVRACGFTERQARFLVLVAEHSGVCLPRQYRAFCGIAHGRQTHDFFDKLVRDGFATTDLSAPAHAGRVYHLQYKPWYRLLGEPDHPHRRAMSLGRAIERLMVLDAVLAEPHVTWLGLSRDKVAAFTAAPFCVAPDGLPRTTIGGVVRPFPDPCRSRTRRRHEPLSVSDRGAASDRVSDLSDASRGAARGAAIVASPPAAAAGALRASCSQPESPPAT